MMRKFYLFYFYWIISLNFEIYSLQFLQEVIYLVLFKATIYIFGFKEFFFGR